MAKFKAKESSSRLKHPNKQTRVITIPLWALNRKHQIQKISCAKFWKQVKFHNTCSTRISSFLLLEVFVLPISFSKNLFYMCDVPNPKGNCVTIHGTVFKVQGFCISLHPDEGFVLSKTCMFCNKIITLRGMVNPTGYIHHKNVLIT